MLENISQDETQSFRTIYKWTQKFNIVLDEPLQGTEITEC